MTKKHLGFFFFGLLFSILSGCSSCGLKGQCEKVNWYQYGFDLALKGQRIDQDAFVSECRKADADIQESKLDVGFKAGMAQYCTPEAVFKTGKSGDNLNLEFCDPGQAAQLKQKYTTGLREFCTPDAALTFGLSGSEYKSNCPQDLEKDFLEKYKKGRRKYLESELESNSQLLDETNRKLDKANYQVSQKSNTLFLLPTPQKNLVKKYDPVTKQYTESWEANDPFAMQRESLQNQLQRDRAELKALESKQSELTNRRETLRRELLKVSE